MILLLLFGLGPLVAAGYGAAGGLALAAAGLFGIGLALAPLAPAVVKLAFFGLFVL